MESVLHCPAAHFGIFRDAVQNHEHPQHQDRSLVWKLTKHRYYGVPIIRDGKYVVFELNDDTQVIGKYLDAKLKLGLFPFDLEGVQSILWRNIENEIEGAAFRLNDIYWKENVPAAEQLNFLRHKERKFGRGCIDQWRAQQADWLKKLEQGPAAVRGNARAQFILARRGAALRGF